MLYVSILTSDRERDPELWATIWNGSAPPSVNLVGAYNLAGNQRVFIWEGESVADLQFMDRFNEVGVLDTKPAFDRTEGWRLAMAKDLEGFSRRPRRPGLDQSQFEAGIDLRRRGLTAPNREAARAAARQWQQEQSQA